MKKIDHKPWGWCMTLDEGIDFKVKRIYIKPNSQFSLQYHNLREEHWVIVEGIATITQDKISSIIRPGEYAYIPKKGIHRLHGGDAGTTFIEVQKGECKENDIVRIQDDYGRS